jgi:solute carrier family 36 (proton-coupled amino acid transporter)
MKGFVCVSILYVPKCFLNGGYIFSSMCLVASCFMTCYCASKLLDARAKVNAESYTALGKHCYGTIGEMLVNFSIAFSQIGFTIGYIYFIKENLHEIAQQAWGDNVDSRWFCLGCFLIFSLLTWVRKV